MNNVNDNKDFKGIIGVCGGSSINNETYKMGELLGEIIANHGYILVCGGLGGTMEAVCKGVKQAEGTTIGILPDKNKSRANDYIDIAIPTGLGEARNLILIRTADGIISMAGGAGTLSELAFAWKLGKPIVSLSKTGGWSEKLAGTQIDNSRTDHIHIAKNPQEAVTKIVNLLYNN